MRRLFFAILATAFALSLQVGFTTPAQGAAASPKTMAKPCRDNKGHFMKCPPGLNKPKPKPCRDKKGKFIKCK
jgi:hypothetical protein